ncbi:pilus assembly protein Flp/PilA [Variovorax sp. TBS-050B]|jgi:pilus assembly protein Flp/PilA|uniref:Flp family type IVb pilin n=1 Tax=Variovorax sp. TBS-050B TaxID=2940551 RepID=UPI002476FE24|nr:Flp family type IVb pilin [Variovorax sp. TBS-050B]MDH6591314.1 pilus assembly protein Flp/PilA [Variovorax sp. TBS-050B]
MLRSITRFLRDEEGATAIEYGIIAGLMATILVAVFTAPGTGVGAVLEGVFARIATAVGG